MVVSPWMLRYEDLYPCLGLTLGPSLVPLNAYMCHGCPTPVWEDPAQTSLLDLIAPSPMDDLVQRWSLSTLALEPFPRRSCCCFINWIPIQYIGSIPRVSFILPPTLSSLGMFVSFDLMLLLGKTKSHVNLYRVLTLVDTRRIWKLSKSPLLSCL